MLLLYDYTGGGMYHVLSRTSELLFAMMMLMLSSCEKS